MVSFTPPEPRYPTSQQFGRQPPRGPIRGFLAMWKIIFTQMYYPKTILGTAGIFGLFAVPLIQRESYYQYDAKKGSPWDRILNQREKDEAAKAKAAK